MDAQILEETSDKFFYKKVIRIGLPITLAQLLTSLLAFVDTIMVSGLGDNAVSAVGIGANFAFLMFMINFGLVSGLAIFFSQFWGNKDIKSIHKSFIVTIIASMVLTSVFFVFGHFITDFIVSLYNNAENVANHAFVKEYANQYLRIASFSYFATALSFTIIMLMRSIEKVIFPQLVTIGVVLLNTFLNYVLINGKLGFPLMGIEGAALATVISSFMGATIFIIYMINTKHEVFKIKLSEFKEINREFVSKLLKKALPVMLNETFWGLGMTMFLISFTFISDDALGSYHISNQIMGMIWVINAGIASACAVMLGNKLGENNIEIAKNWGKRFIKLSFAAGIITGVILFISSPYIPLIFKGTSESIQHNIYLVLIVFSFYIPIKFTNAMHIIGTLRSGGDTLFAFFAEVGVLWGIGVPLAWVLSRYTSLPLYAVVAIVNVEEIVKAIILNRRFFTYKWLKNLTE